LLPASVQAQGAIVGQTGDVTGIALPGVIVEAIGVSTFDDRRVMTRAVTADDDHYQIDLPPGVYSVRFSLPGFGTAIHEGIGVEDGCHIPLDARLLPIDLREGVTATGVAPDAAPSSMADRLPPVRREGITHRVDPGAATPLVERASRRDLWRNSIERKLFSKHIEDACLGYAPMWLSHLDVVLRQRPCQVAWAQAPHLGSDT
jgi:hypothetical protein|tara:strand:+ start:642 stop:1250 length:609 start_codon:yes stop_codon:yes gene_type:complete